MTDLDNLSPPKPKSALAQSIQRRAATLGAFLAIIWLIYLADTFLFQHRLLQHGIYPRTLSGLQGILFAPFLHANFSHIASNTTGIILLGGVLILRSESAFWAATIIGALATGIGTWVIGRDSLHVGASGVIFAYFGALLAAGFFERRVAPFLLSTFVFLLWGGMLWGVLPSLSNNGISWEGHLSGLAGGILTAKLLADDRRQSDALNTSPLPDKPLL